MYPLVVAESQLPWTGWWARLAFHLSVSNGWQIKVVAGAVVGGTSSQPDGQQWLVGLL